MKAVLVISDRDNVATALEPLEPGRRLTINGGDITVSESVAAGHKIAIAVIARGDGVLKYGSPIGTATIDIAPGQHVHTHNVASARGRGDLAPAAAAAESQMRLAEPSDDRQGPTPALPALPALSERQRVEGSASEGSVEGQPAARKR